MNPSIAECLGLTSERVINLIGGGGKTSLMFSLARELATCGERVITTTTTRILKPDPQVSPVVILGPDSKRTQTQLRRQFQSTNPITVALAELPGDKLAGIGSEVVDEFGRNGIADRILVEADGSAGRSLKAHKDHEPVISSATDLVVVVIGIDCIGAQLDDRFVHRAELFGSRLDRALGSLITIADVAAIVHHPDGYLAKIPATARVVILLNKVDDSNEHEAINCARSLYQTDSGRRLDRIVLGSIKGHPPWLRVVRR